jgi:nicotinamide mononucleotide transporter
VQVGSTIPVADAFTTALCLVGIWPLVCEYLAQWLIWTVVDIVTCGFYFYKAIPFKTSLNSLYVAIVVFGYLRWRRMMQAQKPAGQTS